MQLLLMKSIRTSGKSTGKSGDAGIAQFTGEDDEVMKNSEKIV